MKAVDYKNSILIGSNFTRRPTAPTREAITELIDEYRDEHRGKSSCCIRCGYQADLKRWGYVPTFGLEDFTILIVCPGCGLAIKT